MKKLILISLAVFLIFLGFLYKFNIKDLRSAQARRVDSFVVNSELSPSDQQLVKAIQSRIILMESSEEVDMDQILTELNHLPKKTASEILNIIVNVDFGGSDNKTQGPYFILQTLAEHLRPKANIEVSHWVIDRLKKASTIPEITKWSIVLDLSAQPANQDAYIQYLEELPAKNLDIKNKNTAEILGRVLGSHSNKTSVEALLSFADDDNESKQVAVGRCYGYVQDVSALEPIISVIDRRKSKRQVTLAILMLGHIAHKSSVEILKKLGKDSDIEVSSIAKESLQLLESNNPGLTK